METDFVHVTEVAGDAVSVEQVQRMCTRYSLARAYSHGKDVLELGCGSGQGLGLLASVAKSVMGGDYSWPLLKGSKDHYKNRIPLVRLDAQALPVKKERFDVVILFEAIYYLREAESFVEECLRVLRPGGYILICNPNKDLPDFNPSPHSYRYFSACDFVELMKPFGLELKFFGDCEVDYSNPKQRFLAFIKKTMVRWDLMPKTMAGKKLLKRLVFGNLVPLPAELTERDACQIPCSIDSESPNVAHKVIFAVAQKKA